LAARRIPLEKPPTKADIAKVEQQQAEFRGLIGRHLKEFRTEAELSLRALSYKCDVSPSYLSAVERGQHSVTADILVRLAYYLKVSVIEFFT
jgi:ribosome-binding protein aMBF1 (putative translation factor)